MNRLFPQQVLHTLLDVLLDVFYPPVCYHCETLLPAGDKFICPTCRQQISAFNGTLDAALAGRSFDRIYILFEYGPIVRELIHLLKYNHTLALCALFAQEASHRFPCLKSENYTAVIPVPLHKTKRRERGYNQSEEIARALARQFNLCLKSERLLRLRYTSTQTKKSRQEREENMKDAFTCIHPLMSEKILLIDDVITTGSTIESCICTLKRAGATRVDVFAIAHPRETG